jgi:hypothetical protein
VSKFYTTIVYLRCPLWLNLCLVNKFQKSEFL